ncbi:MAG TPA: 30S ribosomal protein S4 [Candidatus Limnocylindrales bacterium]|nr:30S ribosomal protein S4 [Candidatus Limnocylindrales bacterium]
MARYTGPVCKLCRAEGMKLYLKGERCFTDKCPIERRNYPPGQHGQRRSKVSDYGIRLREKQKVKRIYGVLEKQFRRYFQKAAKQKGVTGAALLISLERRLDNVVHRLGFASSIKEARQLVRHRHILVNGKLVDIPSYQVSKGDVIEVKAKSRENVRIKESLTAAQRRGIPPWLSLDAANFKGTVVELPKREDISPQIQEQLIVELYSK